MYPARAQRGRSPGRESDEVTGEGKALFPKMRVKVIGVLNHMLGGFTKSEARQLESLLQRVLANMA